MKEVEKRGERKEIRKGVLNEKNDEIRKIDQQGDRKRTKTR